MKKEPRCFGQRSLSNSPDHYGQLANTPPRGVVLAVVLALLVGAWIGTSGLGASSGSSVNMKLVDSVTPTTVSVSELVPPPSPQDAASPPPPAPANYSDKLSSLYGQVYDTAAALPSAVSATSVITPRDFDAQLRGLSSADLGYINRALPVSTVDRLSNDLQSSLPVVSNMSRSMKVAQVNSQSRLITRHAATSNSSLSTRTQVNSHVTAHTGGSPLVPQSQTIIPLTMPTNDPFAGDVGSLTYTATCPAGAPAIDASDVYGEGDIFALQIAGDVVSGVYDGIGPWAGTGSPVEIGFGVASSILAVIALGLAVAHDTLDYFQTIAGDCSGAQMQQIAQNTENNTFQTYTLLTNVAGTVNEINTNVANLTNLVVDRFDQQLMLSIEQSLTGDMGSIPIAAMELPGTSGGYLDSVPGTYGPTVASVVSSTIAAMLETNQRISAMATRYLGLGQQALGAGEYKLAFSYFRQAYQAAAA